LGSFLRPANLVGDLGHGILSLKSSLACGVRRKCKNPLQLTLRQVLLLLLL
jgi:hypothetical protein